MNSVDLDEFLLIYIKKIVKDSSILSKAMNNHTKTPDIVLRIPHLKNPHHNCKMKSFHSLIKIKQLNFPLEFLANFPRFPRAPLI